jgi:peptidoglycan/xylan/chitin deacetylase (PgdA/CDA1 family)
MVWKKAARVALHHMGGLAVLRRRHRNTLRVLMFHSFSEAERANVDAMCAYITRHFQPVSLSEVADALDGGKALPQDALAVTVDDGYRNFLLHGHPIFRRHRIPTTLFAVAGFSDRQLWLWHDQIEFGLLNTTRGSVRATLGDEELEFEAATAEQKSDAIGRLSEKLKEVPNDQRVAFVADFGRISGVEIPRDPPRDREAMSWDELRAVSAEGVEIGCHTETHPILSRLGTAVELEHEIRGARQHMEDRLGFRVRHFCYPNGRAVDIGEAAIRCVRDAGYGSAVISTWGLNAAPPERFEIRRLPFDSKLDLAYGKELLAGLHV